MDSLTVGAIALAALLAIGVVGVLIRRRLDRSSYHSALPLDVAQPKPAAAQPKPPAHPSSAALSGPDRAAIAALVAADRKLDAIRRVRELTGMGLKEAKDYVEALPLATLHEPPVPSAQPVAREYALAEVAALLAQGNKIAAIKRVRELTGMGLKEAKDYVESMPAGGPLPALPTMPVQSPAGAGDIAEVHALAQQGRKIEAIKRYRELTGVGLKEAKDYVDRL